MPQVTEKYEFHTATVDDVPLLMEMALKGFVPAEPHNRALNLTGDDLHELVRWLVEASVHTPYSIMAIEKATGKMVGFCLYRVAHRDESKDFIPFDISFDSMPTNVQILGNLLNTQKQKIWTLCPKVEKVLRQEIIFVDKQFHRQGIAKQLVNLVDCNTLKAEGFSGIQSEATSYANQKMLTARGFAKLSESNPEEYRLPDGHLLTLPDETKTVQLFFKEF